MELPREIGDAAQEAWRRAGANGANPWNAGWVFDTVREATSWGDARTRILERIVRTAAAPLRDDHVIRGLFLSQMLSMGILLSAPLTGLPSSAPTRLRQSREILGMIGGETTGEVVDAQQLRRNDPAFAARAIARVVSLNTGGHWRISPIAEDDRLRCWFVPRIDGVPSLTHPLAQSVPFAILP